MYRYLDKLNVKSNLPNHQISEYVPKKFRTSSDICKYDCSFEESFLSGLNEASISDDHRRISTISSSTSISSISNFSNGRRKSSILRNEEIMKSLAALKEELSEEGQITRSSSSITNISNNNHTVRNNSAILRMKAETAAEMYLGVEDTGRFLRFLDFYVSLFETISLTNPSFEVVDSKVVKVFDLLEGDVQKTADFLEISEELEELGFEEDKIVSALMLNSNDREAALDFLMKN